MLLSFPEALLTGINFYYLYTVRALGRRTFTGVHGGAVLGRLGISGNVVFNSAEALNMNIKRKTINNSVCADKHQYVCQ